MPVFSTTDFKSALWGTPCYGMCLELLNTRCYKYGNELYKVERAYLETQKDDKRLSFYKHCVEMYYCDNSSAPRFKVSYADIIKPYLDKKIK